jgi:hypothetical protein
MKILDVSSISAGVAMPIKSGTLQFIQDAYKENTNSLFKLLVDNPVADTVYIISGCENSTVAPIHTLSAGVLFCNSEIFEFDGATFTLTGLQKAYAKIVTTQFVTNADPVEFSDSVLRNVHNIRKITIENTTVFSSLGEFKDFIKVGTHLKGDTKEVVCDSTYLAANFDGTGLGRLERLGWAICNGNNGTVNHDGRVVIAYGTNYPTLGATGGSKDAVLVEHSHAQTISLTDTGSEGGYVSSYPRAGSQNTYLRTDTEGVSGTDKNMQPYIVLLRIQKL